MSQRKQGVQYSRSPCEAVLVCLIIVVLMAHGEDGCGVCAVLCCAVLCVVSVFGVIKYFVSVLSRSAVVTQAPNPGKVRPMVSCTTPTNDNLQNMRVL